MNTKADQESSPLDTVKLAVALLLVTAGVIAFYYYSEASQLLRVLGLLGAVIVAVVIGLQTDKGRQLAGFFKDSQIEVRKVVWPTGQETMQTTGLILVVVVIVAIGLWCLDMSLGWLVKRLTGLGG